MQHDYARPYRMLHIDDLVAMLAAPHVRSVCAASVAAFALLVGLWCWESGRIAMLDRAVTELEAHNRTAARSAERVRVISAAAARDVALLVAIERAHRAAIESTNAVAEIGNALPAQTWLTTLAAAPSGSWQISGRSTRVAEIGTTLRAIAVLAAHAPVHLQTIAASGRDGHMLDFMIAWDRRP